MINWTEEDVEYICTNILKPALEATVSGIAKEQGELEKITNRMLKSIGDAIYDIRYEQERDRRFYKAMFTQVFDKNEAAYDEFYKSWCEEFDRLNKEKTND
jgi:hypothetical protein